MTVCNQPMTETASPVIIKARWPGIMSRATAAEYCDLTVHGFDDWVRKGRLPQPIPGTKRWSRIQIDRFVDTLVGGAADGGSSPVLDGADLKDWLKANGYEDQA
jgi:hypothetical protein